MINWQQDARWLRPADLKQTGNVLVIAPHQDDESLGCGGTIALLRQAGVQVQMVFTTNGSLSHPNSKQYPAAKLTALREQEAISALHLLGVDESHITFLRLQDGSLPVSTAPGFAGAVKALTGVLGSIAPQTILLPWQRDPHPDHRATWQITQEAIRQAGIKPRQLEYLIWLWERAGENDLPMPGEVKVWKVDIKQVMQQKKAAITAHRSQTTRLIGDDPDGFILSPEVLAHFDKPEEVFVEFNKV